MGTEIDGDVLGEEYKGYIFRITGGNDKQGFPMKQGVMVNGRVRLLMKKSKFYRLVCLILSFDFVNSGLAFFLPLISFSIN
jgi:hypothetical protein